MCGKMDEKKIREAIKWMKNERIRSICAAYISPSIPKEQINLIEEHYNLAIEALEKQLPKKPIDKSCVKDNDTIYGYVGICPSCNDIVDDSMIVCDCTQVLDWSE